MNYYEFLGVEVASSAAEIEAAIKQREKIWQGLLESPDFDVVAESREKLRLLAEIEQILLDPRKRAAYDTTLKQLRVCPNCGSLNRLTARFCATCGYQLRLEGSPSSPELPRPAPAAPAYPPPPTRITPPARPLSPRPPAAYTPSLRDQSSRPEQPTPPPPTPYIPSPSAAPSPSPAPLSPLYGPAASQPAQMPPAPLYAPLPALKPRPSTGEMISGEATHQITRYGRAEYYSPMDLEQEYRLRIGLLLERHGRKLVEGVRVKWMTLLLATQEEEPTIRVTPSSGYFRISPPIRDVKVKKDADVFADFRIVPLQIPATRQNITELRIDFEYNGQVIQSLALNVQVQQKFGLGPLKISHMYWKPICVAGGAIASFDTAASLYQFLNQSGFMASVLFVFVGGVIAVGLLLSGLFLMRRAGKRIRQTF